MKLQTIKVNPRAEEFTKKSKMKKYTSATILRLNFFIKLQAFFGINRLYLLHYRNSAIIFSSIYSTTLVMTVVSILLFKMSTSTSHFIVANMIAIEYFCLYINALFIRRGTLLKFFNNLQIFDEALNIRQNSSATNPITWFIFAIVTVLIYNLSVFYFYVYRLGFLGDIIHDVEILFFCALVIFISRRLRILKSHALKLYYDDEHLGCDSETLSRNISLNISSIHKFYDLLHKCSRQLNAAFSFPVLIS